MSNYSDPALILNGAVDYVNLANRLLAQIQRGQKYNIAFTDLTSVQGAWTQATGASQTDTDPILAGGSPLMVVINSSLANLDEMKMSNVTLLKGTYIITVAYEAIGNGGIMEVLHGTTSIGTQDTYSAVTAFNQVVNFVYSPAATTKSDFRIRSNGKNGASGGYGVWFSRIQITKIDPVNVANGIAQFDSSANLPAPSGYVNMTRDGSNGIGLAEATSSEIAMLLTRIGAHQYQLALNVLGPSVLLFDGVRMTRATAPALYRSAMMGSLAFSEMTQVQGIWAQVNNVLQTDFDDLWVTQAGIIANAATKANLDELKLPSLTLNAGTYAITIVTEKNPDEAILECLFGTTSIGTSDLYSAGSVNNNVVTFTYSPTTRNTQDLRFRANGKNAASSNFAIHISRIQIIKTA